MMKLNIRGGPPVPVEKLAANVAYSRSLGLPMLADRVQSRAGKLACVGGGKSAADHLSELKAWDGDVWGVNGACKWLRHNGVNSVFVAVDPLPCVADWAVGASSALVASQCDPLVFEALKGVPVIMWDNDPTVIGSGASTMMAIPILAVEIGYSGVTFFGCDSSYPPGRTHAYHHEPREQELMVRCGGVEYRTAPDFYVQALELGGVIRQFPTVYDERSGGLLRAIIEHGDDHEITWVSPALDSVVKAAVMAA